MFSLQHLVRYVLPDELKEEVHRIISYKFLCIESSTIVSISSLSNDLVRVEIRHEKTFKNITGHTEPFSGTLALDEWGFSQKSEILECRLEIEETKIDADDNPELALMPNAHEGYVSWDKAEAIRKMQFHRLLPTRIAARLRREQPIRQF